jgi:hypothetical protein
MKHLQRESVRQNVLVSSNLIVIRKGQVKLAESGSHDCNIAGALKPYAPAP